MNRWLRIAVLIGVVALAASGWLSRERRGNDAAGVPPEAVQTLRLIEAGGPFPYDRDGSVFQNREGLLPQRPRGYYREYTVPTPGSRDRGARRIVSGGDPPEVLYYTDDHYRTFRPIGEPPP
jgi:guanyl-specific ribonuclease Sa